MLRRGSKPYKFDQEHHLGLWIFSKPSQEKNKFMLKGSDIESFLEVENYGVW